MTVRVLVMAALMLPNTLRAQASPLADGACDPRCRISSQQIAHITDASTDGVLGMPHEVAVDESGRVFVVVGHSTEMIHVFDHSGQPLQSVGRKGDGPGEFQDIRVVLPRTDGVHVLDQQTNRWTVLKRDDLTYLRSHPLPKAPLDAVFWGDTLVLNAQIPTADLSGFPLHLLAPDGRHVRALGYDSTTARVDVPYASDRSITFCPSTGVLWAAEKRRYRITGYHPHGRAVAIQREPDWFEPHERAPRFEIEQPPPPILRHVRCDADGYLWTIVLIPDPEWRESLVPAPNTVHGGHRPTNHGDYFDTIIEVIDSRTGRVVASGRMDRSIDFFPADGIIASYAESTLGEPSLTLWQLGFLPPR